MFNSNGGYSLADIATATGNERDSWGEGGAWWIIILFLFMFMGWGGNNFGRNNEFQGALTRSDMFEGFNNQDVNAQLRGITNGLCDTTSNLPDHLLIQRASFTDCTLINLNPLLKRTLAAHKATAAFSIWNTPP